MAAPPGDCVQVTARPPAQGVAAARAIARLPLTSGQGDAPARVFSLGGVLQSMLQSLLQSLLQSMFHSLPLARRVEAGNKAHFPAHFALERPE